MKWVEVTTTDNKRLLINTDTINFIGKVNSWYNVSFGAYNISIKDSEAEKIFEAIGKRFE